jgi:hypothetical protein
MLVPLVGSKYHPFYFLLRINDPYCSAPFWSLLEDVVRYAYRWLDFEWYNALHNVVYLV